MIDHKKYFDRKIAIDIETTGMNKLGKIYQGHRIIEIGCIEILNRELTGNNFHVYINPNQNIDKEALKIHRISRKFLSNQPDFSCIYKSFIKYVGHSEIIVHNANFDISFINYELKKLKKNIKKISDFCKITDTLKMARILYPGKKNNLHALCKRYNININQKKLHSALFDAHILAKLYLLMTSKQKRIIFEELENTFSNKFFNKNGIEKKEKLIIIPANKKELNEHNLYLKNMKKKNICLWNN
ncbi:DNA polymerase III subunit epsilon [Buchnera aphidicola (Pterocallis alni)]|uniref:DNA polymerase III subunit epsilon n=1 Tax=Buchnera aphidicola TaxID=9 RepID=UPI0034640672